MLVSFIRSRICGDKILG